MVTKAKSVKTKKKSRAVAKKDNVKLVRGMANQLLDLLGTKAKAKVSEDKENEAVKVDIETEEEAGLLIGNRGETLTSIQSVLGSMVRTETGEWQRIVVNVADWREREEKRLRELAKQTAERAKATGEPQPLYNLTPTQRRIVHLELAEDAEIETESQGEGRERFLVVKPKG